MFAVRRARTLPWKQSASGRSSRVSKALDDLGAADQGGSPPGNFSPSTPAVVRLTWPRSGGAGDSVFTAPDDLGVAVVRRPEIYDTAYYGFGLP